MNEILMQSFLSIAKDRVIDWVELQGQASNKNAVDVDVMDWHEGHGQAALKYDVEPFENYVFYVRFDDSGISTSVFDIKRDKYITRGWNGKDKL